MSQCTYATMEWSCCLPEGHGGAHISQPIGDTDKVYIKPVPEPDPTVRRMTDEERADSLEVWQQKQDLQFMTVIRFLGALLASAAFIAITGGLIGLALGMFAVAIDRLLRVVS